mmetsp:Transcript_24361/g.67848  ORF Transcript_24361/g.67848 Transcript_24361/m.67848 type:complete len:211 (-) Transcript_24361:412-1044(-)
MALEHSESNRVLYQYFAYAVLCSAGAFTTNFTITSTPLPGRSPECCSTSRDRCRRMSFPSSAPSRRCPAPLSVRTLSARTNPVADACGPTKCCPWRKWLWIRSSVSGWLAFPGGSNRTKICDVIAIVIGAHRSDASRSRPCRRQRPFVAFAWRQSFQSASICRRNARLAHRASCSDLVSQPHQLQYPRRKPARWVCPCSYRGRCWSRFVV